MRILILGCAGYLGSLVTKHMITTGHDVVGLDSLLYNQRSVISELQQLRGFSFVEGSIGDTSVLPKSVDAVINLAGYVGGPITERWSAESFQTNVVETIATVDFYRRLPVRYLFVSTCSNYGVSDAIATEESALTPLTPYARHKVAVEAYIQALPPSPIVPTVLRFATAFGVTPRTRVDLTINEFVYQILAKRPIEIYGASAWRPYCHVSDFAKALEKVVAAPAATVGGEIFNVGADENNYTKAALVETIADAMPGATASFKIRAGADLRDYRVGFAKFDEAFDHSFLSVPDGIDELVDAFRNGTQGWTNTPTRPGSNLQRAALLGSPHKIPAQ